VDWVAVEWSRALWHDNAAVRDMLGPVIFYGIRGRHSIAEIRGRNRMGLPSFCTRSALIHQSCAPAQCP
jgi:hypothetical protein